MVTVTGAEVVGNVGAVAVGNVGFGGVGNGWGVICGDA